MTLKPQMSKSGDAERVFPSVIFRTISQQLERNGVSLYLCGATATTSPYLDQKEQSCCSMTTRESTGTFTNLIGTTADGGPAGGTERGVKCLQRQGRVRK